MAQIELRPTIGDVEHRDLSRTQPLSIGHQSFNDITIEDEGVGPLHCRIGWTKTGYEVTAAGNDGVDVNGQLVQHAILKDGDVLRIGQWDLVFQDSDSSRRKRDKQQEHDMQRGKNKESGGAKKSKNGAEPKSPKNSGREVESGAEEDLSLFEGPVIAESIAEMLADAEIIPESQGELSSLMSIHNPSASEIPSDEDARASEKSSFVPKEVKRQVSAALRGNRVRPGEQEILKSPLVLGLGGGGLIVLLVTATIWFLMGRDTTRRLYERADQELNEGRYSQAILTFDEFLKNYPGNSRAPLARIGLGKARIQKELSGATPSWKRGLEELEDFLEEHRNDADFKSLHPVICDYAEQIARGAVKTAEATRDSSLLQISADAARRLEQFSDPQQPPVATLEQIRVGTEQAQAAIRKQQTFDAALAGIEQAFQVKQPISVLRERSKLLQSYPDLASHKRIREALQQAVDMEKSVVSITNLDQAAATTETVIPPAEFTVPLYHTRSRTEEAASGRLAYAVAKDALYAVDVVTGESVWRRLIGAQTPFFPLLTSGSQPGILVGESHPAGLALRQAETGQLIWRQTLPAALRGAPLVYNGEIFVAVTGRLLLRLDLDTGRLKEQITFSQDVVGPPTVAPGEDDLLIAGETALIYGLSLRPLEVVAVTFSNHPTGAISVPLLPMGKLVLMCDNDRLESSQLRVWDAGKPREPLIEVDTQRIAGQVVDSPMLRGSQLVVAATGERLYAYTVSDDPAKKGLASIGRYQVQEGYRGPMQLALGPDQQFWMASSAFRRFEVTNDSLRLDQHSTAPGIAAQPLQFVGDQFFVARRPLYSSAVIFTQVDRDRMAGSWRTILGAKVLAWTGSRNGGLVAVTEAGTIVLLSPARLQQGGLELRGSVELELPADLAEPLQAAKLSEGSLACWSHGPQPKLWLINNQGQIEAEHKLDAPLDAAPILLKGGLILPLPGRLKWLSHSRGGQRVEDFVAPVADGAAVRWKHLVALDEKEFVTCDQTGRLSRIQIRQDNVAYLGEAASFQLPQPVDVSPVLQNGELWISDAAGAVRRLDGRNFDVKAERALPHPVVGLWADGDQRLVQLTTGRLASLSDADGLPDLWTAELETIRLLGPPVRIGESLHWVSREGWHLQFDGKTGQELKRERLPQTLGQGLLPAGSWLLTAAEDGTIYRLTASQGAGQ